MVQIKRAQAAETTVRILYELSLMPIGYLK
jgi:hypothetical protein